MASFGDLLLRARGINNPRNAAVAALLDGAGGVATPTAPAPGGATAPGQAAPGAGAATPPQPQAYQSPPDLLDLYSQLTDYDTRSRRIDTGLGLLGSAFAQPQNRQTVFNALSGNGSGAESPSDALSVISAISEARNKAAAEKAAAEQTARIQENLGTVAGQLGIPIEQLQLLYDTEGLDETLQDRNKVREAPKLETEVITDNATGNKFLINKQTGEKITSYDTGLAPSDASVSTAVITDEGTGKTFLINKVDGSIVKEYPTTAALTTDQKQYQQAVEQGYKGTLEQWLTDDANRKQPVTNVNIDNGARTDNALVSASDQKLVGEDKSAAQAAASTINNIRNAQSILSRPGGVIAGSKLSGLEYESRKLLADVFGLNDEAVNNTATYSAAMGDVVRSKVKELGTGNSISNADREYTEKSVGAGQEIPADAMPRILSIMEFGSRNEIIKYNKRLEARLEASRDEEGNVDPRVAASLQPIPVPEISDQWMAYVPEGDLNAIKAELAKNGSISEEDRREIDKLYGPNATDAIVEKLNNGYGA